MIWLLSRRCVGDSSYPYVFPALCYKWHFQAFIKNYLDIVKWSYYAMCQVQPIVPSEVPVEEFGRAKISEQAAHNGHNGLEWRSTHQCTIQKIPFWDFMDGMNLSPRGKFIWSEVFFLPLGLLFSLRPFFFCGSSLFFFLGSFRFYSFLHHPNHHFFLGGNSYLPLQPTYHPSSYQPIYLPHSAHPSFVLVLSSITNTWNLVGPGFRVVELQKSEEKQGEGLECPGGRSLKQAWKTIELQGKLPSSFLCFFFKV